MRVRPATEPFRWEAFPHGSHEWRVSDPWVVLSPYQIASLRTDLWSSAARTRPGRGTDCHGCDRSRWVAVRQGYVVRTPCDVGGPRRRAAQGASVGGFCTGGRLGWAALREMVSASRGTPRAKYGIGGRSDFGRCGAVLLSRRQSGFAVARRGVMLGHRERGPVVVCAWRVSGLAGVVVAVTVAVVVGLDHKIKILDLL